MRAAEVTSGPGRESFLVPTVFFLSALATSLAPRISPAFIAIIGSTLVVAALRRGLQWRELMPSHPALAACLLFISYVLLSVAWSADPLAGAGKGALLLALILVAFAATAAVPALDPEISRRAALAFVAGAFIGAIFVAFELLTGGLGTRTAMQWIPFLEVSPKHVTLSPTGEIKALKSFEARPER